MTTEVRGPAEIYDTHFVPALFAQWGPVVAAEAGVRKGDRVLDVACGTGALTLAAAKITGPSGSVVGLDANPDMLAVARGKPGQIEWLEGKAEALPLPDNGFDVVVSQFGFMFFEDKPKALAEMMRVLRPGGRLAVAVCDAVENSPGYGAFALLLDQLFGKEVGDAFRAPFSLGNVGRLQEICSEAGLMEAEIVQRNGKVRFRSIDALVSTERACVWTLGGVLTDQQFERLLMESETALGPFVIDGGTIEFDMPSLIIKAWKS
ncbi:Ubiquinone/menaquinone biosynthesis methyltransferase UbiE (plasmid) [Sinorhizobium sojae CCBAU 05684]|uniref:Ubiquinone/menaquinone biosynthesis methyltransferase UbiE n=1 Tax=Sinorhizobium sojae CCBAU 05684 TaxID=716928 RepID=A0A249PL01_9HYPH|nr:class I SAM-dependent methyltransferase [Sinorhizobium sojae]ASY66608.1 Ubiquinone/menaquinone biosynthesis methyltransferase UbiE [Sinorhizobium sojae CCBAU 05684]